MSHGHPYSVVLNEYGVPTAVHPMPTQLLPSLMRPDGA